MDRKVSPGLEGPRVPTTLCAGGTPLGALVLDLLPSSPQPGPRAPPGVPARPPRVPTGKNQLTLNDQRPGTTEVAGTVIDFSSVLHREEPAQREGPGPSWIPTTILAPAIWGALDKAGVSHHGPPFY